MHVLHLPAEYAHVIIRQTLFQVLKHDDVTDVIIVLISQCHAQLPEYAHVIIRRVRRTSSYDTQILCQVLEYDDVTDVIIVRRTSSYDIQILCQVLEYDEVTDVIIVLISQCHAQLWVRRTSSYDTQILCQILKHDDVTDVIIVLISQCHAQLPEYALVIIRRVTRTSSYDTHNLCQILKHNDVTDVIIVLRIKDQRFMLFHSPTVILAAATALQVAPINHVCYVATGNSNVPSLLFVLPMVGSLETEAVGGFGRTENNSIQDFKRRKWHYD
ncbi:hypothetical protein J6590_032048 [Homalodisca vitripennis]|nr:hypothetical protein J6590_032048 [Homalodisca vitripennis]